jgi:Raf kinase inhibitor-like YbhB/YbcL family protein
MVAQPGGARPPAYRRQGRAVLLVGVAALPVLLAGCGFVNAKERPTGNGTPTASLTVTSSAFADGAVIPRAFTCKGADVSPPLQWSGVPSGARSLALVVDDPDAPGGTFTHWVVFDIDPTATSLAADAVPPGARQARNSAGHARYDGPCPPSGRHHYRFRVYVLRSPLTVPNGADKDQGLSAIDAKGLADGTLTGTFAAGG